MGSGLRRRLLNLLTALSLLLCVAVCVLWVRSYAVADQIVIRLSVATERTIVVAASCLHLTPSHSEPCSLS